MLLKILQLQLFFLANIKNLHKFMIKDLKKLNNDLIEKKLNPAIN